MTIELARRLLAGGAPAAAIEVGLMVEVGQGVPFVVALTERFPELAPGVERELVRSDAPEVYWVRPALELLGRLPTGLCERLLAVPVQRDLSTGRVDVAAVDTLSPHVAAEFAFHLDTEVRVLRAPLEQVRAALLSLKSGSAASMPAESRALGGAPGLGDRLRVAVAQRPAGSEPPIPLVRRPTVRLRPADTEEPVLNLAHTKFFAPERPFAFERSVEDGIIDLSQTESAEQVAVALCRELEPALILLVASRAGSFELRRASRGFGQPPPTLALPSGKNSVFDIAARAGFYLGPLPATLVHTELRLLLPSGAADEVYAAPILVANRPALVLLMSRFGPSLEATRRADRLIGAASAAIERILLKKKRGLS